MEEFSVTDRPTIRHIGRRTDTALDDALLKTLDVGAVRIPLKERKPHSLATALYQRGRRLGYKVHVMLDGDAMVAWLDGKKRKQR